MAEGGAQAATTVIKEILQNADDAGASEIAVILDERHERSNLPAEYSALYWPALLVRNDAPFHLCEECRRDGKDCDGKDYDGNEHKRDDFHALLDVAAGHKRAQATAAGRFGIGFNSVHFLTDTPLIFSRREVHLFDLLRKICPADNGWTFSLDDFPVGAQTEVEALKAAVEWCLPKAAITEPAPALTK